MATIFSTKLILGVQHLSSALECSMSALLSVLLLRPAGSLHLVSCPVRSISDWYTMFFNPTVNYTRTLHCTHEAVYPL